MTRSIVVRELRPLGGERLLGDDRDDVALAEHAVRVAEQPGSRGPASCPSVVLTSAACTEPEFSAGYCAPTSSAVKATGVKP